MGPMGGPWEWVHCRPDSIERLPKHWREGYRPFTREAGGGHTSLKPEWDPFAG